MFKYLKSALGLDKGKTIVGSPSTLTASSSRFAVGDSQLGKTSEWATLQGVAPAGGAAGKGMKLDGEIGGKPWRIEQGRPSRDFIVGLELRARAELALQGDVAVMIMSRSLKADLDKRAFSIYTDTLQTQIDPSLPEEMRWLSMYEEFGWERLGNDFLDRYAILADELGNAQAWVTPDLVNQLMAWPSKQTGVPMVLMVLRGKAYLRMQINEGDQLTSDHATRVFTTSCEAALAAFS